jgi:hypothetical protein
MKKQRLTLALMVAGIVVIGTLATQLAGTALASGTPPYWEHIGTSVFYNDGNVGIGTSNPSAKLQLSSSAGGELLRMVDTGSTSFADANAYIRFAAQQGNLGYVGYGSATNENIYLMNYRPANVELGTNSSTRLTVTSTGTVGIGTSTPGNYMLSIKEAVTGGGRGLRVLNAEETKSAQLWIGTSGAVLDAQGTTDLRLRTGGVDRLMIDNGSGHIGINTVNPGSSLEVTGGIRARGGAPGAYGADDNGYAFSGNGGDNDSGMFSSDDGQLDFYTNNSLRMKITESTICIGTCN